VRAASFNYHDVFTVRGMPGIKVPLPVIIGLDMAGEIAEVGAGVSGWKAGDRVLVNPVNKKKGLMGEMLDGGMAEYCAVAADQLVAMPAGVSFEQAAALPVAGLTALRTLRHGAPLLGKRVLVTGAAGGVGHMAVQIAARSGAHVTAVVGSPERGRHVRGADAIVQGIEAAQGRFALVLEAGIRGTAAGRSGAERRAPQAVEVSGRQFD